MIKEEEYYLWSQELSDWEKSQDYYERLGLDWIIKRQMMSGKMTSRLAYKS